MHMPRAVRLTAHHVVVEGFQAAVSAGLVDWDQYPELGEGDWQLVSKAAEEYAESLRPPQGLLDEAMDKLAARAADFEE